MNHLISRVNIFAWRLALPIVFVLGSVLCAQEKTDSIKTSPSVKNVAAPLKQQNGASSYRAARSKLAKTEEIASKPTGDTINMEARLIEIPGKFLSPTTDAMRYFAIGAVFNVLRIAALGTVIGLLYDRWG